MIDKDPSAADPFGQLADELLEALRETEQPSVEAFAQRYAEHADNIRDMLPALELMEQAKSAGDTPGRRQAEAAPLRQLRDCQTLCEGAAAAGAACHLTANARSSCALRSATPSRVWGAVVGAEVTSTEFAKWLRYFGVSVLSTLGI